MGAALSTGYGFDWILAANTVFDWTFSECSLGAVLDTAGRGIFD
jgi:hypothetical protein